MEYEKITCFNRDPNGRCLAYNEGRCSLDCQARITDINGKISLIKGLLIRAQSKKDKRNLERELQEAIKIRDNLRDGKFEGWMSCYMGDVHRGEKGGRASEGDSNRATGMKQLMKDNRSVDVKPNKAQQKEYKEALIAWEEENGRLDRLGRSGLSGSRRDSYTGVPICFYDSGVGFCRGQRSGSGRLSKECKICDFLKAQE